MLTRRIETRLLRAASLSSRDRFEPAVGVVLHVKADHAVAAMMLMEEGKLGLDDPLSNYIPAFASTRVRVAQKSVTGPTRLHLVPS
jgi:hypothetical protein